MDGLIEISEHQEIKDEQLSSIIATGIPLTQSNDNPKFLGLSLSGRVGYFIGAKWIKEGELALIVKPKIEGLDYLQMFMHCFNNQVTSSEISKIYSIDFKKKPISIPSTNFELTPLLIVHFLNIVKTIVKKGLKRDYIWVEQNLSSKIKGKILINQNIKYNTIKSRPERTYCKYQEYSQNCIENKLIKKTLGFVFTYIKNHYSDNRELLNLFYFNNAAFLNISNEVDYKQIIGLKTNSLYKEYNEVIKVAKLILSGFNYSIHNAEADNENYPPFHIDMSLLFELYIFSKLFKVFGNEIKYQVRGEYGVADFLNIRNKTILDSKYKTYYRDNFKGQRQWKRDAIAKDVRQLSGYSRDKKILVAMGIEECDVNVTVDCVMIYPNQTNTNEDIIAESLICDESKMEQFIQFYKYGIRLPVK